jgi:hypothetical protein
LGQTGPLPVPILMIHHRETAPESRAKLCSWALRKSLCFCTTSRSSEALRFGAAIDPRKKKPPVIGGFFGMGQPVDRTNFPGLAPVSSPFSKMGVPEQIVMS